MSGLKQANPDHPIHELLVKRWSPYAFADRSVAVDDLRSLFEAARWAASSYNEQPWRYIVATRESPAEFERLLSCLVEGNQPWANRVPVLALGCAALNFAQNNQPNRVALHDLGLASANLSLEATARGLSVHQMAGILPDRARELYQIPIDVQPLTGLAIGYVGTPDALPESYGKRDLSQRQRKPVSEFVFAGQWGSPASVATPGEKSAGA
jgi:nitroreductase